MEVTRSNDANAVPGKLLAAGPASLHQESGFDCFSILVGFLKAVAAACPILQKIQGVTCVAVCVFWFVCVCACACVCPLAACVLASVCLQGCVCVWVCGLCFPSCMCVCVIVPVSSLCVCLCAPSCPGCVDFLRTMSLSFAQISKRRCPGRLLPPVAGRPSMPPSLFFLRSALE